MKRMYVIRSEQGGFWCGIYHWDTQLRKAQIFHSLKYAGDVVERFKQYNPKIVEVSLAIVNEPQTHADRIRAMSDEELAAWLVEKTMYQESAFSPPSYLNFLTESDDTKKSAIEGTVEWLKQPPKEVE